VVLSHRQMSNDDTIGLVIAIMWSKRRREEEEKRRRRRGGEEEEEKREEGVKRKEERAQVGTGNRAHSTGRQAGPSGETRLVMEATVWRLPLAAVSRCSAVRTPMDRQVHSYHRIPMSTCKGHPPGRVCVAIMHTYALDWRRVLWNQRPLAHLNTQVDRSLKCKLASLGNIIRASRLCSPPGTSRPLAGTCTNVLDDDMSRDTVRTRCTCTQCWRRCDTEQKCTCYAHRLETIHSGIPGTWEQPDPVPSRGVTRVAVGSTAFAGS